MESLKEKGWLDLNGKITTDGLHILSGLVAGLPRVHEGVWGEAFVPITSKLVRVCADIAIIKDRRVLLKWRKDEYWEGWEMPGESLGPGKSWKVVAERFGEVEFGIKVSFIEKLETFNNTDNPRNHDVTVLLLCEPLEEPNIGKWFNHCPEGMIQVHQQYWPAIKQYI